MIKSSRGMLVFICLLFATLAGSLNLFAADINPNSPSPEAIGTINQNELRMHLDFLASKELGGRYTLSPSFAIAAKYLATRLQSYGFKGAGEDGSFYQPFEVITATIDREHSSLTAHIGPETATYKYGQFYNGGTKGGIVEGPVVFAGYGISSPSQKHDDYANLDVKGKIALIATGAPAGVDQSKLADTEFGVKNARAHGAIAVLLVPIRYYAEAMKKGNFHDRDAAVALAKEADGQLPVVRLAPDLAEKFLPLAGLTLQQVHNAISRGASLPVKELDATVKLTLSIAESRTTTQNVVAVLRGADPKLKDEYVTFSAHYDHLRTNDKGQIYPGADDDGSGTASVLNIAKALSLQRPKRSVLVIFHAGEELGLLGSAYNTDYQPVVPLSKLVVDLNIDMIGRSKAPNDQEDGNKELTNHDTIYIIGVDRMSKELQQISVETNSDFEKLNFDYLLNNPAHPERIFFRSDHWNYGKHGIPFIFYFDGISVDYHQPTDTVDKIDFEKMTNVARLVFETGWRIANLDHRVKVDAAK